MNSNKCIVASLPNLPISNWDSEYVAVLRATSKTLSVVSVGKDIFEAREKAYRDISQISDEKTKFRAFGDVLNLQFGDELVLRGHIRVFAAYCDYRTYYIAERYPPKSVYVGIAKSKPLKVKFVRIKDGL